MSDIDPDLPDDREPLFDREEQDDIDGSEFDGAWVDAQMIYARWWYETGVADEKAWNFYEEHSGEDLMDFVDGMKTLRTFGPNPLGFDPPISKQQVEQYFKGEQ